MSTPPPAAPETAYERRLRDAGPELLKVARSTGEQLGRALELCPCVASPVAVTACLHCRMRAEYRSLVDLVARVEFGHSLDSDCAPLLLDVD